jgi:hypothetical protein
MVSNCCSIEEEMSAAGCRIYFPLEIMAVIGIAIMDESGDIKESS